MLEDKLRALRAHKDILLMPHLVLGYPSFDENARLVDEMVAAGAEIIEMQLPFSEPMADGPVILRANDLALKAGATTDKGLAFARDVAARHPQAILLFMTYYNVLFARGVPAFLDEAKRAGAAGLIVPDLPPEEAGAYFDQCAAVGIDPIMLFTPTNTQERLKTLAACARGMVYGVGRKGVTGIKTQMDDSLDSVIARYKAATSLPLGIGFGIQNAQDVAHIRGKADIAILGTKILSLHEQKGARAVGAFLKDLR